VDQKAIPVSQGVVRVFFNQVLAIIGTDERSGRHLPLVVEVVFGIYYDSHPGAVSILAAGGYASIQALGRNPSAAPKIFTALIVLLIFGAAISVIALLVLFQLYAPA